MQNVHAIFFIVTLMITKLAHSLYFQFFLYDDTILFCGFLEKFDIVLRFDSSLYIKITRYYIEILHYILQFIFMISLSQFYS